MIPFLGQHVEACRQPVASLLHVAFDGGRGGIGKLVLEVDFVQVARIAHLARQQLDLQVAVSQGQEIGHQRRIDFRCSVVQVRQRHIDDFVAVQPVADQADFFVFGALSKSRRQFRFTHSRHDNQFIRHVFRRRIRAKPRWHGVGRR